MAEDQAPLVETASQFELLGLQRLLALSDVLIAEQDEARIVDLVLATIPALGNFTSEGISFDARSQESAAPLPLAPTGWTRLQDPQGTPLDLAGRPWSWGYPLVGPLGRFGSLMISAESEPDAVAVALLARLAAQASAALAHAGLHRRERARADELRGVISALQQSRAIHDRLTDVAISGGGQTGIADALLDLTGHAAVVEDRYGNLVAWAGPGRPDPYPRESAAQRSQMFQAANAAETPIRFGGRLISIASAHPDIVGVIALIDPEATVNEFDHRALELATTVHTLELTRVHKVAHDDLRLRAELVMELVSGRSGAGIPDRAQTLDYDLGRPHRVLIIEFTPDAGDRETITNALRRAARMTEVGSLFAVQQDRVILLANHEVPWDSVRAATAAELRSSQCRLGVGRQCDSVEDFPHSYLEAEHALQLQKSMGGNQMMTVFDDLGIYQLLSDAADPRAVEAFTRRWLGQLLDHDAIHGSQLVLTLTAYLDSGGRYDQTAEALFVHRNTLKYRLGRIREVSGLALGSPDINFNLQLATRALRTLQALQSQQQPPT